MLMPAFYLARSPVAAIHTINTSYQETSPTTANRNRLKSNSL
jgi:hypothetical protein